MLSLFENLFFKHNPSQGLPFSLNAVISTNESTWIDYRSCDLQPGLYLQISTENHLRNSEQKCMIHMCGQNLLQRLFLHLEIVWMISLWAETRFIKYIMHDHNLHTSKVQFIYSDKATKFCEISTNYLSYVLPVK